MEKLASAAWAASWFLVDIAALARVGEIVPASPETVVSSHSPEALLRCLGNVQVSAENALAEACWGFAVLVWEICGTGSLFQSWTDMRDQLLRKSDDGKISGIRNRRCPTLAELRYMPTDSSTSQASISAADGVTPLTVNLASIKNPNLRKVVEHGLRSHPGDRPPLTALCQLACQGL